MSRYYYNSILLPEIPSDVLAEYPYCFITKVVASDKYQLLASKEPWYFNGTKVSNSISDKEPFLSCLENAETWTVGTSGNYSQTLDGSRVVVWANCDICQVVNNVPVVFFRSTELYPETPSTLYQIKGAVLSNLAEQARIIDGSTDGLKVEQMEQIFENAAYIISNNAIVSKTIKIENNYSVNDDYESLFEFSCNCSYATPT